jgi:hypothetical protein
MCMYSCLATGGLYQNLMRCATNILQHRFTSFRYKNTATPCGAIGLCEISVYCETIANVRLGMPNRFYSQRDPKLSEWKLQHITLVPPSVVYQSVPLVSRVTCRKTCCEAIVRIALGNATSICFLLTNIAHSTSLYANYDLL